MALTAKQRAFLRELPKHQWNATKAALAVGCTRQSARKQGSRWMQGAEALRYMQRMCRQIEQGQEVKRADVIREAGLLAMARLTRIGEFDGKKLKLTAWDKLGEAEKAALTELSFDSEGRPHVKMASKVPALELMFKHLGLFLKDNKQRSAGDLLAAVMEAIGGKDGSRLTPEEPAEAASGQPAVEA